MGREYDETLSALFESTDDSLSDIRRFPKGMHYDTKLALCLTGKKLSPLLDDCLLSRSVQGEHADFLLKKFKTKLNNSADIGQDREELFGNFRFLTILDALMPMTHESVMRRIKQFKKQLKKFFNQFESLWVVGAIEVEIVNMSGMRLFRTEENAENLRKLNTLEELFKLWVLPEDRNNESYALIHFHGLVFHPNVFRLNTVKEDLTKVSNWQQVGHQVMMKGLSRTYNGKHKPLVESLEHIANYITKGGTDRVGDYVYLRYKHNYSHITHDPKELEDEVVVKSDLISEVVEDYSYEDKMSFTYGETIFLAKLTHSMMRMNRLGKSEDLHRKGHLIIVEKRKKRSTKRGR
jgi:hypothetical protein